MGIGLAMSYNATASRITRGNAMPASIFRLLCLAALVSVTMGMRLAPAATPDAYDPWPGLVQDIFNNRPMNDGTEVIGIEMPYRAEDAAVVPGALRNKLALTDERRAGSITLAIHPKAPPIA